MNYFVSLSQTQKSNCVVLFFTFIFFGAFGQAPAPMTIIDSLLMNKEYHSEIPLIQKMRGQGKTDKQIYDFMEARAKKHRQEMLKIDYNKITGKNKKVDHVTAGICSGDSLGIESGNFGAWKGETRCMASINCTPTPWVTVPLPVSNRITIASSSSDPCADLPGNPIALPSPYGGNFSIKLGNHDINAETERVSYTFTVQPTDSNFVYQYATVLENPSNFPHVYSEQPFFDFVILDALGDTIPCSFAHYVSGQGAPGFFSSNLSNPACNPLSTTQGVSPVYYTRWSLVGVNLSAYVGQAVTVVCTSGDCSRCGHFGYTYVDFSCGAISDAQYCVGQDSILLTAPADTAFDYLWSTGQTTSAIYVSPIIPYDTVTVDIIEPQGCGFTLKFVLKPTFIFPGFSYTNVCNNYSFTDTTNIQNGIINTWNWNFGDGSTSTVQNPNHTYTASGTYTVTLIVASSVGCKDTAVSVPITIPPLPVVNAGVNFSICPGSQTTLNATATPTGGTYSWTPTSSLNNPSISNPIANPATSTTYVLTYADPNGCTSTDAIVVGIYTPVPLIMGTPKSICPGGSTTLGVSNGSNYVWSPAGSLNNPNISNPIASPSVTTIYSLSAVDLHGCPVTGSQFVTVVTPTINAGTDKTLCMGKTVVLSATPSAGTNTYLWTPSTGLSNPNISNPIFTPSTPGTFTYSVTLTNTLGCTVTDFLNITVNPLPTVLASAVSTICPGKSASLTATSTTATNYSWSPASSLNNANISNPVATPPTATGTYNYVVIGTDANGCTNSDTTSVFVGIQPVAYANYSLTLTCEGANALFTDSSLNALTWNWDFGDGETSTLQDPPMHSFAYNGLYVVTLVVTNGTCRDTAATAVPIGDMNSFFIATTPNVFTPNGDGLNDCFEIILTGSGVEDLKECMTMEVYDRWGIKVFESIGGSKVCWDGNTKTNIKAKDGTYYFLMTIGGITHKGYVTLVRETK